MEKNMTPKVIMKGTLLKEGLWFWNGRTVTIDENGVLRYFGQKDRLPRHTIELNAPSTSIRF